MAKTDKFDMRPIKLTIPAFALSALADKAREWSEHFYGHEVDDAAAAWYAVVDQLEKAHGTANATKEA